MKLAPLALALALAVTASAQTPQFTDPANLRGERVAPLTGRELPIDQGALGLQQLLRKLATRASILNIVAHPDDEDGGMLTFYARGLGARVADLSLTRGEGGQNAMTGDFEDALGLLRTQELLANDRYTGVDQFFGTEVDFGFSKTKSEALAKWGHDRLLYDAVRAIRLYRPLIITSTWVGGVTDGHGQHQASGEIAQEAFKAAGDPNVFPELTAEGILPWQPLKVFARVPQQAITPQGLFDYATGQYVAPSFTNYVTGEVSTTPPTPDVIVHEGATDPLLGPHRAQEDFLSYVQFAREGLGQQKSQIGPGFHVPPPGPFDVSYHLYGSCIGPSSTPPQVCHLDRSPQGEVERSAASPRTPIHRNPEEATFFDGIDTTLEGIASLAPNAQPILHQQLARISGYIASATQHLNPNNLATIAPTLANALKDTDTLIALVEKFSTTEPTQKANVIHELRIKRAQLDDALVIALGLSLDATMSTDPDGEVVSAPPIKVHTSLQQSAALPLGPGREWLENAASQTTDGRPRPTSPSPWTFTALPHERLLEAIPSSAFYAQVSFPYFLRPNIEQPFYDLDFPQFRNAPATPPGLTAWAAVTFEGAEVDLGRVVHDGPRDLHFVAPIDISVSPRALVLPLGAQKFTVTVTDHSRRAGSSTFSYWGFLGFPPTANYTDAPGPHPGEHIVTFTLSTPFTGTAFGLTALAHAEGPDVGPHPVFPNVAGTRSIGYGDLPRTEYRTDAKVRVVPADLKIPASRAGAPLRIGYLPGTGDAVPEALTSIGLSPTILTVADLTADRLKAFDTVILGVRTYSAHPDLHGAPAQALLDYANSGGNVVVQYQTAEFTAADAPYPLTLGRDAEKVVDETAPVILLSTTAALLTTPNLITPADFNNWVEERGHGFLRTWDPRYTALTETHDPGAPSEGVRPQDPQRGGLVTTHLGKGTWTYCAFALYRQLPEAVPGAFRLFVNLLNP
jgi:LmbE family N-acetylglucosaminyl deacetylase